MKKNLLLILAILMLSTQHTNAMRRFGPSLYHHTLNTRQQFLFGQLCRQRQQRYATATTAPDHNWRKDERYKQLVKDPVGGKTRDMVNQQSKEDKQALLETAAQHGLPHPYVFVVLLEAGADINKPNAQGKTPLHLLAESSKGSKDEVHYTALLAYIAHFKPDFGKKDSDGKRPRDYANPNYNDWFEHHDPISWARLREMYAGYRV